MYRLLIKYPDSDISMELDERESHVAFIITNQAGRAIKHIDKKEAKEIITFLINKFNITVKESIVY